MDFFKWSVDKNCVIFDEKEFDKNEFFYEYKKTDILLFFKLKAVRT